MRLCIRLAAMAALLVVVALGLISLRTDTIQTGNRLHVLYGEKRSLERVCSRLERDIADLRNQERMRQEAAELLKADGADAAPALSPPRKGAALRESPVLVRTGSRVIP
jgi:hypothetical protein